MNTTTLLSALQNNDLDTLKSNIEVLLKDNKTSIGDLKVSPNVFMNFIDGHKIRALLDKFFEPIAKVFSSNFSEEYNLLHCAAILGCKPEIINYLIDKGINVNEKTPNEQYSPLHLSVYSNNETIQALLDRGADPQAVDKYNKTPAFWAKYNAVPAEIMNVAADQLANQAEKLKSVNDLFSRVGSKDAAENTEASPELHTDSINPEAA